MRESLVEMTTSGNSAVGASGFGSHAAALAAGLLIGSSGAALVAYLAARRQRPHPLDPSVSSAAAPHEATRPDPPQGALAATPNATSPALGRCLLGASTPVPAAAASGKGLAELAAEGDDIIMEQFTRNFQFFGPSGQQRILNASVLVVGLGGVGSHAAAMLLRSGVGRLRLVDFDQVSLSSLNRHAVATRADVGLSKAESLAAHFRRILPEATVEALPLMFCESSEEQVLSGGLDFVVDCIDNIDTKVSLIAACKRRNLPLISAMGAGGRADPTRVKIADISESSIDPLSRAVRHRLKKFHGIDRGISVVFSAEVPKADLLPFDESLRAEGLAAAAAAEEGGGGEEEMKAKPSDFQVVPGFRVRIIPVLGCLPAIFGMTLATFVLTSLAQLPVAWDQVLPLAASHYSLLHRRLVEREEVRYGSAEGVEVDVDDVRFLVREVWRGRSAWNQDSVDVGRGMHRAIANMTLTRWDASKHATLDNLILLTFDEAESHEETTLESVEQTNPHFFASCSSVLGRVREQTRFGYL